MEMEFNNLKNINMNKKENESSIIVIDGFKELVSDEYEKVDEISGVHGVHGIYKLKNK